MVNNSLVKRTIFDDTARHLDKEEITLITGSRQVGKTVLLHQLKDYLIKIKKVEPGLIFVFNLDIVQDYETLKDQTDFIEYLKDRSKKKKIYVFVDEAQKIPEAASYFKGIYDSELKIKLILTGSASLELKAKLKESLAGRKRVFELTPFSFHEFLLTHDEHLGNSKIDNIKRLKLYEKYLVWGGYPRAVLAESDNDRLAVLKEIYSSYVERDAINLFKIKNQTAFNRLVMLLAGQIGQLVRIEELTANLGIDRQTAERYILALEQSFIIRKLNPYYTNKRQEIIKSPKIYFADNGLRNLALGNFNSLPNRIDKGNLLENNIYNRIYQIAPSKPHFWRTKQGAEVDFVIEKNNELIAVESKFNVKKPYLTSGLRSLISKFQVKQAFVCNLSINNELIDIDGKLVKFIYPFNLKL